ncbi:MAG: hypothetical protein E7166_02905 [Firmicutes bacterium]|nr:hypothetical protein [Bacillota bacterium]
MSKEELYLNVITNLILEYRLSLENVCKIFNVEADDIYAKLMNTENLIIKDALIFVLNYETVEAGLVDQSKARADVSKFMLKFHKANTPQEKYNVIMELNDSSEIEKIMNKTRDNITEKDFELITKYRYKYALPKTYISKRSDITDDMILSRENKLDEDFKKKIAFLNSYNDKVKGHSYWSKNM